MGRAEDFNYTSTEYWTDAQMRKHRIMYMGDAHLYRAKKAMEKKVLFIASRHVNNEQLIYNQIS